MATKKKVAEVTAKPQFMVYNDFNRRTAIQVLRDDEMVKFIPLDVTNGLEVHLVRIEDFDRRFKPMAEYPVDRAATLYVGYSQNIGATKEALDFLGQIINISKEEYDMATAKKAATAEVKTKPAPAKKTEPKTKAPAKTTAAKEPKAKAAPGEKKETASAMFCELIMAGKLTDDQIFAKVQEKFGLSDDKKSYVKWYRNKLAKDGKNPPAPK